MLPVQFLLIWQWLVQRCFSCLLHHVYIHESSTGQHRASISSVYIMQLCQITWPLSVSVSVRSVSIRLLLSKSKLCVCVCPVVELTSEQFVSHTMGLQIIAFSLVTGSISGPQVHSWQGPGVLVVTPIAAVVVRVWFSGTGGEFNGGSDGSVVTTLEPGCGIDINWHFTYRYQLKGSFHPCTSAHLCWTWLACICSLSTKKTRGVNLKLVACSMVCMCTWCCTHCDETTWLTVPQFTQRALHTPCF